MFGAGSMGCHLIQFPSGRFGYVGSLPTVLATAVKATTSAVLGCRAYRGENGELLEWKFPTFETADEAIDFAKSKGVDLVTYA